MVKHEDKSTGDDSVYSVYEVHCTTDYPPRVYFVGMEILYGVLSGIKSQKKKKKKTKKKNKKVEVARTLHRTFLISLGRRRILTINTKTLKGNWSDRVTLSRDQSAWYFAPP